MNFFRYIQRLKQYSISTSAKHMLSTVIGVLLTSNILSVVLIMQSTVHGSNRSGPNRRKRYCHTRAF